jgi:hypothetical protein
MNVVDQIERRLARSVLFDAALNARCVSPPWRR